MKLNLKKIGAIVAGATILASSVAFAGVMYGNTVLVNDNGQPLAKVIVGEKAAASDGVGAAKIVAKLANNAYATKTLKASATATCTGGAGTGTCDVSQETTTLEVTIPGLGTGVHDFGLLIADFMDRELENRYFSNPSDVYSYKKDLLDEKATPYQNQIGGLLAELSGLEFAQTGTDGTSAAAYRINGDNFVPFSKVTVQSGAGRTSNWDEYQFAWFSGETEMRDKNNDVGATIETGVYALVFGPDMYGLPLCPGEVEDNYWACDASDRIEAYRMQIRFLGENWVISEVRPPSKTGTALDEEVYTEDGTSVTLAKEAVYGIVDVGDCLTWEEKGVKVCLDDISTLETVKPAIVSFRDLQDKIITAPDGTPVKDQIAPGNTEKIYVPGYGEIKVHVYQTAPGYGLLAKWAEFAIYADEIKLEHDKKFINNKDTNWKVLLGWEHKDGGNKNESTHLKEIVLYNPDPGDQFEEMKAGESFPVIDLAGYKAYELLYQGLETAETDKVRIDVKTWSTDQHFYINSSTGGCPAGTTINLTRGTEVISVKSNLDEAFSHALADSSQLYIITHDSNVDCGSAGDILIQDPDDVTQYHFVPNPGNVSFEYDYAGDNGYLVVYNDTGFSSGYTEIWLAEDMGDWDDPSSGGSDLADAVGVYYDDSSVNGGTKELRDPFDYDEDEVGFLVATDGADPVGRSIGNVPLTVSDWESEAGYETPFITLRGSEAKETGNKRTIDVSEKIRKALFRFQPTAQAGVNPDTFTCEKIPEGGTCKVGDVTILVKSIDEVVAPCSVSGGACAVESVNAQIVDENNQAMGAEVKASVPYTLTSNLMYLDTEATGLGTGVVITVGGQAVNTVTAAALEEAGMTIDSTNNVVVKEVGNKIIVAGYTAEDTLAAVDQFLAGVKRQ